MSKHYSTPIFTNVMPFGFNEPRVRTVTQCQRVQKKRKGKPVKCKYHGGCDGYRTPCKWAIRR